MTCMVHCLFSMRSRLRPIAPSHVPLSSRSNGQEIGSRCFNSESLPRSFNNPWDKGLERDMIPLHGRQLVARYNTTLRGNFKILAGKGHDLCVQQTPTLKKV